MPAGASTRTAILDAAERLFSEHGVHAVATRQIVDAAGQRNTSAVSYHFGSRPGLVRELLARRGGPIDLERARRRSELGTTPSLVELATCLVAPYAQLLDDPGGRAYVQVVAQLRGRFAAWRVESDAATTAHLATILDEIEARASGGPAVRAGRVVAMIMVLTGSIAERARRIDDGTGNDLDHDVYVADLAQVCAAIIAA